MDTSILNREFQEKFEKQGNLYFAPGRINLIGEHTDYNNGFVMPGAVDKGITAEVALNGLDIVRLYALDIKKENSYVEFSLHQEDKPKNHWACYVFGVCKEMMKRGVEIKGFDAAFTGNIPSGSGMSSSAALENVFSIALNDIFADNKIDRFELAKIGQATEHNYCGVKCGIMDQFASLFGKEDCLIRLDCRTLEYKYFPFKPEGYKLTLINSCVKHSLGTEYNERRESCERVVELIAKNHPEVLSLRDADMAMLQEIQGDIDATDFKRAKYVLEEKERVLAVCDALEKGDYNTVGEKMFSTHWGLSRDYTVSCEELDFLAEFAQSFGVTGSRVMGGGFGGCTINLIPEALHDEFISKAKDAFKDKFGHYPEVYEIIIGDGAKKLQ